MRTEDNVDDLVRDTLLPSLSSALRGSVVDIPCILIFGATEAVSTTIRHHLQTDWNGCELLLLEPDGSVNVDGKIRLLGSAMARIIAKYCDTWRPGEPHSYALKLAEWLPRAAKEQCKLFRHFMSYPYEENTRLIQVERGARIDDPFERWTRK